MGNKMELSKMRIKINKFQYDLKVELTDTIKKGYKILYPFKTAILLMIPLVGLYTF